MVAVSPPERPNERESGDGEEDIEALWDASHLPYSSARGPWALQRVDSLALPVLTIVVEEQQ